ncbi:unnamed protein product [Rhizoctonia solani]|uniref:HAT C-terminal dimerisation domain-containing protein n=1 Tax=Rhizoctonia solani TaxID=456999 RepID=A0A8H3APW0_9AGAM|nr:unnamed protein product [Rhizoctonia solani]
MSGAVHLIIDGWTNRTPADSLVCVVVAWQEDGRAFRPILDVAWVSDLSPESYVTNFISGCLERYGLIRKIKTICLRNAPHSEQVCAGLHAKHSNPYLQTRTVCYSHVVGLMMEAFTSFLRPLPRVTPVKYFQDAGVEDDTEMDDLELDYSLSEREYNADLVQEAVRNARRELDIDIERKVLQGARNVLSKVTALEQVISQVNSQALKQAYWGRSQQESVSETHRSVVRPRGSRKWGTIRDSMMRCSEFISTFRNLVAAGVNVPGIEECFLDEIEQNILDEFHTGFEVFDDVVSVLSLQETPFLHEVVVELFNLRMRLEDIRNGSRLGTSPTSVTRVAAEAALWAYKLMVKDDELPDICIIAVVMHPTHKLQWFNKRGMDTRRIEAAVIERFNQSYPLVLVKGESNQDGLVESKHAVATDSMGNYLDRPTLSKEVIEEKGGLLNYWNQELVTQPRVAQMALDYLTIPATSVDLTRIFSGGQMATNGLEKHVNYDTFRAMMSMGSWFGTPVLPEIDAVANLLEM